MEPFSVEVKITKKEFILFFLFKSLLNPIMIMGVFVLSLLSIWAYVYSASYQSILDSATFKVGLFIVLLWPVFIVLRCLRIYKTNATLRYGVTYNIGDAGINGVTKGMNSNIEWRMIAKRVETMGYMLLYPNKRVVYIIPIKNLTQPQIESIRQKTPKKK